MTNKTPDKKKADKKAEASEKRISPDSPLGVRDPQGEEDFYQRQRDESEDGLTPQERDQYQKAAPGSLDQKVGDEKHGEDIDTANPPGVHKQQHP